MAQDAGVPAAAKRLATGPASEARWRAVPGVGALRLDDLLASILNPLTRLPVGLDATGAPTAIGHDAGRPAPTVTSPDGA